MTMKVRQDKNKYIKHPIDALMIFKSIGQGSYLSVSPDDADGITERIFIYQFTI